MREYPIIFAVVVALAWPSRVPAAVLRVPEDYPSVLAGVDAAVAGDSVLVGAGTWVDREVRTVIVLGTPLSLHGVMFLKPGVTVIGLAGAAATVLDGGPAVTNAVDTVIHVLAGAQEARIVGMTITGGGNGVLASGAAPLLLDGCSIDGNARRGISTREQDLTLTNCVVANNELGEPSPVGGVWGFDYNITCIGCTFEHNRGPGLSVRLDQGWGNGMVVTLQDCVFQDHIQRGATIGDVPYLTVERCTFLRNSIGGGQVGGGGGLDAERCSGAMRFCTFIYDSAYAGGGAAAISSGVVENNTFYGCYGWFGEALSTAGSVSHNIFANSRGRFGAVSGVPSEGGCNVFWNNAGGDGEYLATPTDIHADPLFCDPVTLDFHLQTASPAAPANSHGCGPIGAFDVGCGSVSVEPTTWGRVKSLFR